MVVRVFTCMRVSIISITVMGVGLYAEQNRGKSIKCQKDQIKYCNVVPFQKFKINVQIHRLGFFIQENSEQDLKTVFNFI